jgi:two-component system, chemotaxis family, CheB/CheR fusion protein
MTPPEKDPAFEALLEYLQIVRGFDFMAYKRSTLTRRVAKRLQTLNIESFKDYIDFLEVHPDEFIQLFNTILINVTSFFRDPPVWDFLTREIILRILAGKKAKDPIRIWSAGCASGEEAYTLAMLFAEALGKEPFRQRVKIYATDVDEEALVQARQAAYSLKEIDPVPEDLRTRYFDRAEDRYVFKSDLRRSVIFGRHDLLQDAPISHMDLLVCRNALMYFNAEAQARILARFHFALNHDGYLFLGKAEMIVSHPKFFVPVDLKNRIFTKIPAVNFQERMVVLAQAGDSGAADQLGQYVRLSELAYENGPSAQIVVDRQGRLTLANEQARVLFGLDLQNLGRPFQDLQLSYRPAELRSLIEQVYAEGSPLTLAGVKHPLPGGEVQYLDVQVQPLRDENTQLLGVSISFQDVTRFRRLEDEIQRVRQELETASEELQSANEELQTTNEELQSTVEELQTTNEELQSSNEEMETMNEELQSTNEELQTMNDELRQRTTDLNQANTFLQSILSSVRAGIVVVDRDLRILSWNQKAEELWGLRAEEVQKKSLLKLDIGLPVDQLRAPIQAFQTGKATYKEIEVEATNRRGKHLRCHITLTLSLSPDGERQGVVLLMEEE